MELQNPNSIYQFYSGIHAFKQSSLMTFFSSIVLILLLRNIKRATRDNEIEMYKIKFTFYQKKNIYILEMRLPPTDDPTINTP